MDSIYITKAEALAKNQELLNQARLGIKGNATQINAPTPYDDITYPDGLFETYQVRTPLTMPNNWGSEVTQIELDENYVYFDVKNGVISKILSKKAEIDLSNDFDETSTNKAETGNSIFQFLQQNGLIDFNCKFKDDFTSNLGWVPDIDYPLPFVISGGIMSSVLTSGQNYAANINIPEYLVNDIINIEVKHRIIGGSVGSKFIVGTSFGGSDTAFFKSITPSSNWQVSTIPIQVSGYGIKFNIAVHASANFGGTLEIDYLYLNKEIAGSKYESILGNVSNDLMTAIDLGGSVFLKPQVYNANTTIPIPNNSVIKGVKGKTIISYTGSGNLFEFDGASENIVFDGIIFDGNNQVLPTILTAANIKSQNGLGVKNAVSINGTIKNIFFKDCVFKNWNGWGIKSQSTHSVYANTMKLTGNLFINNYGGLMFGERSEYHQFSNNTFAYNKIGTWINGGNISGSTNHFNANGVGVVLSGTISNNDTHGTLSACLINHNLSYGIFCVDVNNGFTFNSCHNFEGPIYLENSTGFVFNGGIIDSSIQVVNERLNSINIITNNIFSKAYSGGTFTGSLNKISLNGNRFLDVSDTTSINNSL